MKRLRRSIGHQVARVGVGSSTARLSVLLVIIVLCGFTVPQFTPLVGGAASSDIEYYRAVFNHPSDADIVTTAGIRPLLLAHWGAYLRLNSEQAARLGERMVLDEVPDRTVLRLQEQGITFDTRDAYELAPEWRKPDTQLKIVQFVFPDLGEWSAGIEKISGSVLRHIGDSAVVVRADTAQEEVIRNLDYVEWVGPYEPGFRVQEKLRGMAGPVKVELFAFPGTDMALLAHKIQELGAADIEDSGYSSIVCTMDASALPAAAGLDSVMLIEHIPEMKPTANVGGRIVQAHDLWANTASNLPQNIMGQGQIVHVQDSGIDASHWDFTQGPLGSRILYAERTTDAGYHGTFVSGIVLGNGRCMETYLGLFTSNRIYNELTLSNPDGYPDRMGFAGRAPEATLYSREGQVTTEWANGYTFGARIFTNAWSPSVITQGYSSSADSFMNTYPTALVLFAAGNHGPRNATVSGHGNGKLVLSIGASENMRAVAPDDCSNDPGQIYQKSGRGPVSPTDLRIKPDLVEVGTYVYSTRSDDVETWDLSGLYDWGTIDADSDGKSDYVALSGTSPATAAAAGDAALVRDYLQDVQGIPSGSIHGNLIKTLLIHGAEDLGYGYPSYDQGWGRVNVRNSICPPAPNVMQWQHADTGTLGAWDAANNGSMNLEIIDSTVPLKFTMAHWDTVGSGTLTTDYDLVVTAPDGTRYEGNAFSEGWSVPVSIPSDWGNAAFPSWLGGDNYTFDTSGDGGDDINNIEMVRIKNPIAGLWTAQVVAKSGGGKAFGFAVTGGFGSQYDKNANQYKVNIQPDTPRVVMERDDFGTAVYGGSSGNTTTVEYWLNNGGTSTDSYTMSATLPSGFTATFEPPSPIPVNAGERVHGSISINIGAGVTPGSHTIQIKAISNNDVAAPIAQSQVSFQVDVVNEIIPASMKVTDSPMHESHAAPVAWSSGGVNYIGLAYLQSGLFGERVYFKLSENGGATWAQAVPISAASIKPGWLTITRATSGTYAGRLMIAYSSYNPNGYNGNTADTRGNQIRIAYADYPYTAWTEVIAFNNGEGPATGNSYRAVNVVHHAPTDKFMLIIETMEYSATLDGSLINLSIQGKESTNGGATWGSRYAIRSPYSFSPYAYADMNGHIVMWFYIRDGEDVAPPDRYQYFMYYTGTWSTPRLSWDPYPITAMHPQGVATPQGPNGNRNYGMFMLGGDIFTERKYYHHYTDNAEASPPTFNTNSDYGYGPIGNIVASEHSYGTRWCSDLSYTADDYVWATFFRHQKYDPYGQPNILTAYGNPYPTHATTVYYLTLDCMPKNKVRVAELDECNYGFYDSLSASGGADIWLVKYFHEWELGPSPPSGLNVEHDGASAENNLLTWVHDGTNVAQYNIYRSDAFAGPWNATTLIDTVPVGNNSYLDMGRGEPDGIIWWYVVRAQNLLGMEEQNTYAVPEPGGPLPYGINLTGRSGWVLVSFPMNVSGPIDSILDDSLYGDGLTDWNVAKWYDGISKEWKSYRKNGTKTFIDIDSSTGVWLRLTANGGDGLLTLGRYAEAPFGGQIQLYTGWNLVGYPSFTDRFTSETLPIQADMVAVWKAESPYVQDFAELESVTMTHGNGYWVRATADCTWTILP